MNKRFKNTKKKYNKYNKTIKRGGDINNQENNKNIYENNREGVIDIAKDKIENVLKKTGKLATDTGLKIMGLERIQNDISNNITSYSNKENGILSNVKNIIDKTSSTVLQNVNEVLSSDKINTTAKEAAKETYLITSNLLNNFNEVSKNPVIKEEFKETMGNIGDYSNIFVESMKEPFNRAVNIVSEAVPKATGAALSGAIKVGTDAMAAIPGVGGVIEIGKMINDGSKAASAVFEAGTEVTESISDLIVDTKKNIKDKLNELEEKKKLAQQISNRTNKAISDFENPFKNKIKTSFDYPLNKSFKNINQYAGTNKSRKRLYKTKFKKVRFAV